MLSIIEYQHRLEHLIYNSQDVVKKQFIEDLGMLQSNNINSHEELLNAINNHDFSVEIRTIACWLCGKLNDLDCLPYLVTASESKFSQLRYQSILSLAELQISTPDIARIFIGALNDNDVEVRKACVHALGSIKAVQVVPILNELIKDKTEPDTLRGVAIEALINFPEITDISLLVQQLDDESADVQYWSVFALGQLAADKALPRLYRLVQETETEGLEWENVRQEAVEAIKIIEQAKRS